MVTSKPSLNTLQQTPKSLTQNRQTLLNFLRRNSNWRRQTKNTPHTRQINHITRQPIRHTPLRNPLPHIGSGCLRIRIRDDLDPLQETTATDVADTPVLPLKIQQTSVKLLAAFSSALAEVIPLDDLEDFITYCCGEGIVEMGG